jgi:hypothetical protein
MDFNGVHAMDTYLMCDAETKSRRVDTGEVK